jgi:hypothetical protein
MGDSFLEQAYSIQPYSSGREHPGFPSTKQTFPSSMPGNSKYNESSSPKSIKYISKNFISHLLLMLFLVREKFTPSHQACALGIFLGALVCSVALAAVLTVWLTSSIHTFCFEKSSDQN